MTYIIVLCYIKSSKINFSKRVKLDLYKLSHISKFQHCQTSSFDIFPMDVGGLGGGGGAKDYVCAASCGSTHHKLAWSAKSCTAGVQGPSKVLEAVAVSFRCLLVISYISLYILEHSDTKWYLNSGISKWGGGGGTSTILACITRATTGFWTYPKFKFSSHWSTFIPYSQYLS